MINKIRTIVFSRFQKPNTESFVEKRREICRTCPLNTKNLEKLTFRVKVVKFFSDLYSTVTGKKNEDNLGSCSVCGCSLFYKTQQKEESCPTTPKKWRKIYTRKK